MKPKIHLFLLSALLFGGILCCNGQTRSQNEKKLLAAQGEGYVLLYDKSTRNFYLLQTEENISLPERIAFRDYQKGKLTVFDLDNQKVLTYSLNEAIYGIANFRGDRYESALLQSTGGTTYLRVSDGINVPEDLSCGCIKEGVIAQCDSGGEGANSCEITDGGGAATVQWNNHCQVGCNPGYYACCNE